jgi:hypothetical protein
VVTLHFNKFHPYPKTFRESQNYREKWQNSANHNRDFTRRAHFPHGSRKHNGEARNLQHLLIFSSSTLDKRFPLNTIL